MFRAVFHQSIAALLAAVAAGLVAGWHGAMSAFLGGAAIVLPNLMFALSLWAAAKSGRASVARFFAGELIKVAATLALLAIVAGAYPELNWLAMLAGVFLALKANLLVILIKAR